MRDVLEPLRQSWQGVAARALLDLIRPKAEARHVVFHAYDGYTTNVKLSVFGEDNALLAHSWEGKPIPREHGGPVRVVVPDWYFWKSAKWVNTIQLTAEDRPGFWEVRGYHNEGDPWKRNAIARSAASPRSWRALRLRRTFFP